MILKLANEKVEIVLMDVPELIKETFIYYIFEPNTEHLHPVLTIGDQSYRGNSILIKIPDINEDVISITVTLYNDNKHIIHIYHGKLEYNKYQLTGTKPIRPDFEKYIQSLELKIISLKKEIYDTTVAYEKQMKELEEKGEIV